MKQKQLQKEKNKSQSGSTCRATCKSTQLEHTPNTTHKINRKWLKDLNIRQDNIKLLEENIGKTCSDIKHTNVFLGQSPKTIETKAKINK